MSRENKELMGERSPEEQEVFWAFTAYIFFPIPLMSSYKTRRFVKHHIKQGFIFFSVFVFLNLALYFLTDNFAWKFFMNMGLFLIWCFGIVNVLLGKEKYLPIIGWFEKLLPK